MLEYSGEKRGLFLLFFCFGLELSGKALMAPGSAPTPQLMSWFPGLIAAPSPGQRARVTLSSKSELLESGCFGGP